MDYQQTACPPGRPRAKRQPPKQPFPRRRRRGRDRPRDPRPRLRGGARVQLEIQDRNTKQYLQDDGSVSSNFNTFRGTPDVVGATSATWQYEVTLPHEGTWRMSAMAIDNNGQSDLRGATRDWLITSTGVAPSVAINAPAPMRHRPGPGLVTASPRRATSTTPATTGATRPPPPSPLGQYSFSVRATDEIGLTTSSTNQGRLTINAQVAGDAFPTAGFTVSCTQNVCGFDGRGSTDENAPTSPTRGTSATAGPARARCRASPTPAPPPTR